MSSKLWGKVTSVSVNINFGAKMSILCKKSDYVIAKYAYFLENVTFCEGLYTLTVSNYNNKLKFLRIC